MKRSHLLVAAAALIFSGALVSSDAVAQQPQPGRPPSGQPQPGQPIIVRQPGQVPGQPIGPNRGQPGFPNRGQPGGRPGQPTIIRRPNAPPGVDPHAANVHDGAHGNAEGHGAEHGGHCPGHGPEDPPPHINWYQGLVGVDNDKSQNGTPIQKVLYRYKNDQDECDPKNQEPPVLAAVINLGIVLYLLVRLGKTPIKEGLLKRKKTLMQDMESANDLKTDAETRLAGYKRQMSRIEERRKELHAEYRAQWDAEEKRILNEAAEKSSRMRKDAEFRVGQELKQAQADLLRESVEGALAAAEELVKKRIQETDQSRLAEEYLASVVPALTGAKGGRA